MGTGNWGGERAEHSLNLHFTYIINYQQQTPTLALLIVVKLLSSLWAIEGSQSTVFQAVFIAWIRSALGDSFQWISNERTLSFRRQHNLQSLKLLAISYRLFDYFSFRRILLSLSYESSFLSLYILSPTSSCTHWLVVCTVQCGLGFHTVRLIISLFILCVSGWRSHFIGYHNKCSYLIWWKFNLIVNQRVKNTTQWSPAERKPLGERSFEEYRIGADRQTETLAKNSFSFLFAMLISLSLFDMNLLFKRIY